MKTIKGRVLTFLLTFVYGAFAAAWTGSTSELENMKKIDGKPFYVITTADELAWFANQVNSGKTTINAILDNDVVFGKDKNVATTVNWTPIAKDSSKQFQGVIDGNNHSIYGLYTENIKFAGLIGVLGENGVLKNVTISNGKIKGTVFAGGSVAVNNGNVQHVKSGNTVESSAVVNYVGGIVAYNNGSVVDCQNRGSISSNAIFGVSAGTSYSGGVVGYNNGIVSNSTNFANVSSLAIVTQKGNMQQTSAYAGGVVGYNSRTVNICDNKGSVVAKAKASNSGEFDAWAGGIAGVNKSIIINCSNGGGYLHKTIKHA